MIGRQARGGCNYIATSKAIRRSPAIWHSAIICALDPNSRQNMNAKKRVARRYILRTVTPTLVARISGSSASGGRSVDNRIGEPEAIPIELTKCHNRTVLTPAKGGFRPWRTRNPPDRFPPLSATRCALFQQPRWVPDTTTKIICQFEGPRVRNPCPQIGVRKSSGARCISDRPRVCSGRA